MSHQKIKVMKNGPYEVTGQIPLDKQIIIIGEDNEPHEYKKTQDYPVQEEYKLCRCGKSKDMPYCDQTHLTFKFDGTETASKKTYNEQAKNFGGPTLILKDAVRLCSGARFCHPEHGTWKLTMQSDDLKARAMAIKEAFNCPSGRLVLIDRESGKTLEPELERSISLLEDPQKKASGPLWVKGGIEIESAEGKTYEIRNRITLCRCGRSFNKPFCDGNHMTIGFNDGDDSLR